MENHTTTIQQSCWNWGNHPCWPMTTDMQLGPAKCLGETRSPDQLHPTVLIHRLNVGSPGQQLLDRLLQTATSRQVERTGTDGQKVFYKWRTISPHRLEKVFQWFQYTERVFRSQAEVSWYSRLQRCIRGIYEGSVRELLQDHHHTVFFPL